MDADRMFTLFTRALNDIMNLEAEVMGDDHGEIAISQPLYRKFEEACHGRMRGKRDGHTGMSVLKVRTSHGEVTVKMKTPEPKRHPHIIMEKAYETFVGESDWRERKKKTKATESKVKAALKNPSDKSFLDELKTI